MTEPTQREAEFKPLLFTTTVRNPGRMKGLLKILSKYDGEILTDKLSIQVMGDLMKFGLYRPTKKTEEIKNKLKGSSKGEFSKILLSNEDVDYLLKNNQQEHKEAGFDKGWPSRFATIFDFAKELGFVNFWTNKNISFSDVGKKLANSIEVKIEGDNIIESEIHPEFEQQAFLHAMAKYQRNNPYLRVLNDNVPLILLLQVIKRLNDDKDFNNVGISKLEIPLIIFWKDNNSEQLYKRIKKLRNEHGYNPSWEVIIDICVQEIMGGEFKKFKPESIMVDYPDEFIRKMRLTGLITLRGGGRFIDINYKEQATVDYILENYSEYKKYKKEDDHFNYMAKTDSKLLSFTVTPSSFKEREDSVIKWVNIFTWKTIFDELMNLSYKRLTKDEILKYLAQPVRLEFLVALAIKSKFPNVKVIPNFPIDDEGLPTSTALGSGNTGDIECVENTNGVLVEVTMSEGRQQTVMEVWPISRHLDEFRKKHNDSICFFVATSMFSDSMKQTKWVKDNESLSIIPKTIEEFLSHIEGSGELYIN